MHSLSFLNYYDRRFVSQIAQIQNKCKWNKNCKNRINTLILALLSFSTMCITSPYRTHYISYSCLLFVFFITSLKTVSFLFGIMFNFPSMPSRQTELKKIIIPLCAFTIGKNEQGIVKRKTSLQIHVQIC